MKKQSFENFITEKKMVYGSSAPIWIGQDLKDAHDYGYESAHSKLSSLMQIMLDPENQPPQFTIEEAWKQFQALSPKEDASE